MCDDLYVLREAFARLRTRSGDEPVHIELGDSGTAMRLFTVLCACTPGLRAWLHPGEQLAARPLKPLPILLRQMGAGTARYIGSRIYVEGKRARYAEDVSIPGGVSSQICSALMLQAPYMEGGMKLHLGTPVLSRPYITMTERIMQLCGAQVKVEFNTVEVKERPYRLTRGIWMERDWSAAAFFYEFTALTRRDVRLPGLTLPDRSMQGDSRCAMLFRQLGVRSATVPEGLMLVGGFDSVSHIDEDMSDIPDLVPAFVVAAALRGIPMRITGLKALRVKESDRLEALRQGLTLLGRPIEVVDDTIIYRGESQQRSTRGVIRTFNDHRIAMAFAMASTWLGVVNLDNVQCVSKSFPTFWQEAEHCNILMKDKKS